MSPERAPKVAAIIAAAGFGQRFTERGNKPLVELMGKPLFLWALEAFERHPAVHKIVPVFKENDIATAEALLVNQSLKKVQRVVPGGKERQDSVYNGLQAVSSDMDLVLVHDGARPLITEDIITRVIEGISGFDGAIAAVPPKDTIKEAGDEGIVSQTLERSRLWAVQTPQGFYRQ
ncbi:MAG: 2-C-methyl-D-erythritol 4-phosphate cytidylyltransferase, partial [Desulfobacterales bacterium]|nr:2-C-methyl-D-erythritol 4-phosphate cytidylyltransferase [Desulfobacterales bacterium]